MATGIYAAIVPADVEVIRRGTLTGPEKASAAWKAGAPLKWTSGQLEECAADFTSGLVGIAANDASGTTDEPAEYWPVTPGALFEFSLLDAYAVATHQGVALGLKKDSGTSIWILDAAETEDQVWVQGLNKTYAVGDTKARVYGTFDASMLASA